MGSFLKTLMRMGFANYSPISGSLDTFSSYWYMDREQKENQNKQNKFQM